MAAAEPVFGQHRPLPVHVPVWGNLQGPAQGAVPPRQHVRPDSHPRHGPRHRGAGDLRTGELLEHAVDLAHFPALETAGRGAHPALQPHPDWDAPFLGRSLAQTPRSRRE